MAYNTKAILTDVNQKPIPQFYDAVSDVYRQLTGQTLGGNNYGINAVSWGKTAGGLFAPVAVNDSGHVQSDILSSALPSGAATQATLEAVLAKLSSDPATQTTLAAILAKIIAAPSTEAKQDALAALIGEAQAAPTANTLLARLKNLETKVDAIIADGIKLSGSNLKWTPLSIINTDVGTGKIITVPADKEYWLQYIQLRILTSATVGNRGFYVTLYANTSTNVIYDTATFLPAIAASESKRASYQVKGVNENAFTTTVGGGSYIIKPLPDLILSANDKILMSDSQGIDPTGDTIKYYVRVLQRSV